MGRKSRTKGASFEREIAILLTQAGMPSRRRLGQARDSGHDLEIEGAPYIIECKRRAKIAIYDWYQQAQRAAIQEGTGQVPLVVMRQDNDIPLALLSLADLLPLIRARGTIVDLIATGGT